MAMLCTAAAPEAPASGVMEHPHYFELLIVDTSSEFCSHAADAFAYVGEVAIHNAPFAAVPHYDCLVSPGNSIGLPVGNYEQAVLELFGKMPQARIRETIAALYPGEAGQPIGSCFLVPTDHPTHRYVAHAPCYPNSPETAYEVMAGLLAAVEEHNKRVPAGLAVRRLACPGLGTYTGNLHSQHAARPAIGDTVESLSLDARPYYSNYISLVLFHKKI